MADDADRKMKLVIEADASSVQEAGQKAGTALEGFKQQTDKLNETAAGDDTPHSDGIPGGVRGLHMALRLIGREAGPAAGAAVSAAAAAMSGGILAAILAVEELFQWFDQLKQKAEAFRESQASLWLAAQQGAQAAADAAGDFTDKLAAENDKADQLKTTFEDQNKLLNAQEEAHKKLLDAFEKEQLAAAAGDKNQEAAIHKRFDDLRGQGDLAFQAQRIGLLQQQLGQEQAAHWGDALAASMVEKLRANLLKQAPVLKDQLDQLTKEGGGAEKITSAGQAVEKGLAVGALAVGPDGRVQFNELIAADKDLRAAILDLGESGLQPALDTFHKFLDLQSNVAGVSKALDKLNTGVTKAETARDEDSTKITALTAQIAELQSELKIQTESTARTQAVGMIGAVAGIDQSLAAGKRLTQNQVNTIFQMQALLNQAHENSNAILQLIMEGVRKQESLVEIIKQVQSQMANQSQNTLNQ